MNTLEILTQVFRDIFEDDDLVISPQTTAADVEGWDSLMHVAIVIEAEKVFSVRFTSSQVAALQTVGDLIALVDARPDGS